VVTAVGVGVGRGEAVKAVGVEVGRMVEEGGTTDPS
jgi:hypothetical protein